MKGKVSLAQAGFCRIGYYEHHPFLKPVINRD